MCIIIAKKKGVKFPSIENVKESCKRNPDGFSMCWAEEGKIKTFRSMSSKVFLDKYKSLTKKVSYEDTALVIHARIKTHGSVGIKNTHCFLDKDINLCFSHNGILRGIENRGDMTDSETFFRDIFVPIYKIGGWKKAELAIKAIIGTSKFAFVDENGDLKTFGEYKKDEGILYSNDSYKPYRVSDYFFDYGYYQRSYGKSIAKTETKKAKKTEKIGDVLGRTLLDRYYDNDLGEFIYRKGETDAEWAEKKKKETEYIIPTEHKVEECEYAL